jgi:hypothetical protein
VAKKPACHPILKKMTAGRLSPQAGLGGVIFFIINAILNLSLIF